MKVVSSKGKNEIQIRFTIKRKDLQKDFALMLTK